MSLITYIDRQTGKIVPEKVYKERAIHLLYGDTWISRYTRPWLLPLVSRFPFFSVVYGKMQKRPSSAKKIAHFIKKFDVDASEFLDPLSHYRSFNDFFIRRLKPEARPLAPGSDVAIIPADGRYFFYENIATCEGFVVKGKKFSLQALLQQEELAEKYREASMVMARLCPSDYHRFHFPCECFPSSTHLINGCLYSVNPLALARNLNIFTENKRTLCELQTPQFGTILYLEIGATSVGSIQETYQPHEWQKKGAEKGYFEFGGSSLILLFEKGKIQFDPDLLDATQKGLEIRCLFGQSMGKALNEGK